MRYYRKDSNGYLLFIGEGYGGEEITLEEYTEIKGIIENPPASEGKGYRLTSSLIWEEFNLPEQAPEEEDAAEADFINALNELGVIE